MADTSLVQSATANGTATPAAVTLNGVTAGSLLIVVIATLGTSPTIGGIGGYSSVKNSSGATLSFAVLRKSNAGAGTNAISSVLGGTVTGWIASIFEFSQTGPNCGLQGSALQTSALAQLTNPFPTTGNTLANEMLMYAVASAGATLTPQNSSNSVLSPWSSSQQSQVNVQGLSVDFFWMSSWGQGVGQYPIASGLLSAPVASAQIAAWFNTTAAQAGASEQVGGVSGVYVPQNYQGMIGG